MSGYPADEPAPISYMSVPEEIQYSTTEDSTGGTSYRDHSYMRVPETITLDDPHTIVEPVVSVEVPPSQELNSQHLATVEPELHTSQDKKVYSDLEQRVQVLEEKVQRLNEALGSVEMLSLGPRHGNGFWSVLSFASWIMVPLICVFMYQYKRSA